jgi:hypothetical protein
VWRGLKLEQLDMDLVGIDAQQPKVLLQGPRSLQGGELPPQFLAQRKELWGGIYALVPGQAAADQVDG